MLSGQPSDMISHSACSVLSFDVSMRISTIRVGLAFRCMRTSCTERCTNRSCVTCVHPGECICQFDSTTRHVLDVHAKHDTQHFAFNVGVATFCFSQRLTGECDGGGGIGLQQCSPDSSLRSINLIDEWFCTVIVSKHLIGGDDLLQV